MLEEDSVAAKAFEPGELLWHYTTFAGLRGILNGKLWASSVMYMNDTQEFRYAAKIVLESFELQIKKDVDFPHYGGLVEMYAQLSNFFNLVRGQQSFVCCFSGASDDLSQWRAYGGEGPCFAVGFDPRRLEIAAVEAGFQLADVVYDETQTRDELKTFVSDRLATIKRDALEIAGPVLTEHQYAQRWGPGFATELLSIATRYKHPKFIAEQEWRLVRRIAVIQSEPKLELKFRQSKTLVVPYVELDLPTADSGSSVAAITIGPSPHPVELRHSVGEFAASLGHVPTVDNSSVPYRNW